MRRWVNEDWSLRYIFNYALALHGSYLNNKSAPLPEGENVRPEIERFLRRLGYRLVLKEVKHPEAGRRGDSLDGRRPSGRTSARPPATGPTGSPTGSRTSTDTPRCCSARSRSNKWMPGSVELFTEEFLQQAPDLPPGEIVPVADA